jgi:hypothetical protein
MQNLQRPFDSSLQYEDVEIQDLSASTRVNNRLTPLPGLSGHNGQPTGGRVHSLSLHHCNCPPLQTFDFEQPNPQSLGRLRYWFLTLVVEWWAIELLSWAFSATCMAAIIGVLWIFDGKELPQLGFGLTINGFLSLFSNFAKSALILPTAEALGQLKWTWFRSGPNSLLDFEALDNASRGPWGSLVLLARSVLPRNPKGRRMYVTRIILREKYTAQTTNGVAVGHWPVSGQ